MSQKNSEAEVPFVDARDKTGCYCPGDCACHSPVRFTVCGCTGKH